MYLRFVSWNRTPLSTCMGIVHGPTAMNPRITPRIHHGGTRFQRIQLPRFGTCTCLVVVVRCFTWHVAIFNSPSSRDAGCLTFWCDTWQRRWPRFNPLPKKGRVVSCFFFFLIRARLRETIREILYRSESSFFFFKWWKKVKGFF